jgi:hypothetical protein
MHQDWRTFDVPRGRYRITPELDDRLRRIAHAPARGAAPHAHPILMFVAALGGMGLSIRALSDRLGLAFLKGPVLAGCKLTSHARLCVGQEYDVTARVTRLDRKPSRRFGAADHMTLSLRLAQGDQPFADVDLAMVFPAGAAS